MSASQEKKRRLDEKYEGLTKREIDELQTAEKSKKNKMWTIIIVCICVLVSAAALLYNAGVPYYLPAVEIDGETYTARELNYYYKLAYFNMSQQYGDWFSYLVDTEKPLDEQMYTEDQTWADYFRESAVSSIKYIQALCNAAEEAGFVPSEDVETNVSNTLSYNELYASVGGYPSADSYDAAVYGTTCDQKLVEKLARRGYIASEYAQSINDGFEYTDEEIKANYAENKDTYDYFEYSYYLVKSENFEPEEAAETGAETGTEDAGVSEEAKTAAKAAADALCEAKDAEELAALVAESFDGAEITTSRSSGSELATAYSEFLLDEARQPGDIEVAESGDDYYVVMFHGRDDNSYNTVSVRHILIKAVDADSDGVYSDEEKQTAYDALADVQALWEEDPTEENFISLVAEYSDDSAVDGLYEEVYKGEMVEEFNDFCFAEDRQPGDTGIVWGESTEYGGYHFVYFVGAEGRPYCDIYSENVLRSEEYSAWETALVEGLESTPKTAYKLAN